MSRTIVILGGVLSGPTAAARARETDEHARIVLITRDARVSYAAAGVTYHLSGEVKSIEDLDHERSDFFESIYRIEVRTETEALAIDPARRVLHVRARAGKTDGREETITYDALVFALGARGRVFEPALRGPNVNGLRTLEDAGPLMRCISSGKKRVAVIGAGLHGVAAVDGLVRGGAQVTLVERDASILPSFGTQTTKMAADALEAGGVRVLTSTVVSGANAAEDGRITSLRLSNGEELEVDFVVMTAGIEPRTELLARAGAHLAPDGSVYVTERGETSVKGIYACGICVSVPHVISGAHVWSAQGAVADKTAQVAGANAAGGDVRLAPMSGSMIRRVLDVTIGRTGLSERQARAQVGASFEMTTIHAPSHDAYFPGSSPVLVQLFWDRGSGKLLGAEVAGRAGVDKRIDIAATAITGNLTVEQLASIDLAYAPPYGSQRDPINVAATAAAAERRGLARFITPEDLHARREHVRVLDVRTAAERRAAGSIPASESIPLEELRAKAKELDRDRSWVLYCDTGRRGYLGARVLEQLGFPDAATLEGGFTSWKLSGLPVTS